MTEQRPSGRKESTLVSLNSSRILLFPNDATLWGCGGHSVGEASDSILAQVVKSCVGFFTQRRVGLTFSLPLPSHSCPLSNINLRQKIMPVWGLHLC